MNYRNRKEICDCGVSFILTTLKDTPKNISRKCRFNNLCIEYKG